MNRHRSPLSCSVGNLKTVFLIPVGSDEGVTCDSTGLIRRQVNGASPDNDRAKHSYSTIAGNVFYRRGGATPRGAETFHFVFIRGIPQPKLLCNPSNTNLAGEKGPRETLPLFPGG